MLTFGEARARLLSGVTRVGEERVSLDAAAGRVLAKPLVAREPFPAFDTSAMDGYALATSDLAGEGPFRLPVSGESRTGKLPEGAAAGTACRIFTGAMLPPHANAVLMQEDAQREGDAITFTLRPAAFAHVRRRGEDLRAGDRALDAGARLGPGHLALAASLDLVEVCIARRPVVTILCTGDELRPAGAPPTPATLPESNGIALSLLCRQTGAAPRLAPIVPDDLDESARIIEAALPATDLLITVGGVSVGDHDVVRPALERAGVELDFWRVAIKPGKPMVVGKRGACHVLGLPGNPASAMVTFALFAAPLLRAMQGDTHPLPLLLDATLATPIKRKAGRLEFLRATLERHEHALVARPLVNQASGAVTSMAWGDSMIVVPAEVESLAAGARVEVMRLSDV